MNDSPTLADRPALLRVEHVSRLYPDGNVTALCDVSLSVRAGEYLAIMGPSGSGKSTLLNLLGALDIPTSGEVYLDGQPLSTCRQLAAVRAHRIGFVFQSFHLLPTLTAWENVQVPMFEGARTCRQRAQRASDLLALVGLSDRACHLPAQLSVGQRQRVAIARALANDPPLLLADEPTGNLDSQSGSAVLDLFDTLHRKNGLTLVVITHSQEVAARAQRVLWIRDGRVTPPQE
jgi:putative ABC transport system ATP-binding protein